MAGTKQKRIDELEMLLREARPVEWILHNNANAALAWYREVEKTLRERETTNEDTA